MCSSKQFIHCKSDVARNFPPIKLQSLPPDKVAIDLISHTRAAILGILSPSSFVLPSLRGGRGPRGGGAVVPVHWCVLRGLVGNPGQDCRRQSRRQPFASTRGLEIEVPDQSVLGQRDLALLMELRVPWGVGDLVEGDVPLHLGQHCMNRVFRTALVEAMAQGLYEPRPGTTPKER